MKYYYYPFGSLIPNRHGYSKDYRYGFQGQEKDDQIKGEGNSYDFEARIYDPRIGRWFKQDPLFMKYAYDSPYSFAGNSPISIIDPDGKRKRKVTITANENGEIIKTDAKLVDYSLKRKVRYETDPLSGDAVKVYDYYDTVDVEYIVKDKNNKVLTRKIVKNDSETLSHSGVSPITPEAWLILNDRIDDIPQEKNDPLKGNEKDILKEVLH
ncbi:RHS repeat-associated core domain-containing protein [Flavobacterium oreochromis]|uniref:RHS repeat domain-containing protein n=1 Tax=Flavobacterium oreochromis TaxID=2906078 RepID=UPI00385F5C73